MLRDFWAEGESRLGLGAVAASRADASKPRRDAEPDAAAGREPPRADWDRWAADTERLRPAGHGHTSRPAAEAGVGSQAGDQATRTESWLLAAVI